MTIAIVSDVHCHAWSAFSKTDPDGVNSRLRITLNELKRAATTLIAAGGRHMVMAGDMFQERGKLSPDVLNPVQETIRDILDMGVEIHAIPGNHDLASKETTSLGSSIQTLAETFSSEGTFRVYNKPQIIGLEDKGFAFVPWFSTTQGLLNALDEIKLAAGKKASDLYVVMHAGIDGVIDTMPGHGLTVDVLKAYGFKGIFAGHYHNRRHLGHNIWSVGATTHHKWTDVNSKAGFMLLQPDGTIKEYETRAPQFIDVSNNTTDEMELLTPGNIVRFRGPPSTQKEINEWRQFFMDNGAVGVSVELPLTVTSTRVARTGTTQAVSVDQSVMNFANKMNLQPNIDREEVKRQAAAILADIRAVDTAA